MNKPTIYQLAVAGVQKLIPYKAGKPIEELERELGLTQIIKLASNENPLGPSPKAVAAMQAVLADLALYPDGSGFHLKQALAAKYGLDASQITLGNGSNEILELVARAFLTPELAVVFSQHAFAVYPLVTQAVGATAIVVPARDYGHDLAAMAAAVTAQTRLVFIANPNNPTGTLLAQAELEAFIAALPETVICVLDEAYFEFVQQAGGGDSIAWLQKYPNLLITRTFSKAYGLAGLRVGYSLSSPELADILNRVRQPFNNNSLALAAAEAALADSEHLHNTITNNSEGMQQLTEGFKVLGLAWIPSAGNFVSVDIGREGLPVYDALLHKGVIVRPVANYEMPNFLRISIGTAAENAVFLQALADVLR
ncbi:histidinol-phosphate transaminase [Methylovulum psychrotolerans]|uniref:Histidinol-phosphate aminotransferase n=1 Tax=Methylovulum psychrotolerans TaxID=1704499 RepID=A0A1Z4C1S3_9GAMM|nr:histidinol-phosphate transaminase [Methylovulum psychrotolerans]ASF47455.1 histidinol-phosphate transaminase [Methylovulum psychrotolerans]